jgi:hypothetical protein
VADISGYLALITSEHNQQPDYFASVSVSVQPFADIAAVLEAMPAGYDLDVAIGVQEDAVGLWVGRTRYLTEPLNAYFTWDDGLGSGAGLGWAQGQWFFPGDPISGVTKLLDDPYRILLRAKIAANNWDGSIPGSYAAWDTLFADTGFTILVQDYGNLSMAVALVGSEPDAVTKALFTTGELDLKPAGVSLFHVIPGIYPAGAGGTPLFAWGVENENLAGWGVGAWSKWTGPE